MRLPPSARFCARCGVAQRPRRQVETWVLVLFGVGIVLSAGVALVYAGVAISPGGAPAGMDTAAVRGTAAILGVVAGLVCVLQCAALAGLGLGREWGRVLATAACVAWSFTCVGIPVALLTLNSIWRRPQQAGPAPPPLP